MKNPQLPLGFLGGAFDPVHIGHLRGAMAVRDALNLDGGSSTTLVVAGQTVMNGRGSTPRVHNGLGLIAL